MEPLKRIALANHADLVRIARAHSHTQRHYLLGFLLVFEILKSIIPDGSTDEFRTWLTMKKRLRG